MLANQKLSDWASIAEIVSGLAVVVTLIFLIVEVNGNTEATLAANRQSVAARVETMLLAVATSPELASVIEKAGQETPLDALEFRIYNMYVSARARNAEEAFLQFQDGQLSEQYFSTRAVSLLGTLNNTQAQAIWDRLRDGGYFTSEFSDWLDQILEERHGQ